MFKTGSKLVVLGSAVGMPYVFSNNAEIRDKLYETFGQTAKVEVAQATPWTTTPGQNPLAAPGQPATAPQPGTPAPTWGPEAHAARLDPVELRPLAEVLRFDITTAWVLANWSRVSTALADINLQGYRVALITGTGEGDLAGALTYYFNPQQQVERIVFQGTTGDARPLVELLTTRYHFEREVTSDSRQYVYSVRSGRTAKGQLRMRPVAVVRQDEARARYEVGLVIERPE